LEYRHELTRAGNAVERLMDKGKVLDSWKEIAAYLNRNVRTCQDWEHDLGLPVHRLEGLPKARVFAYTAEIDAWRDAKGRLPGNVEVSQKSRPPATVTIRRSARAWMVAAIAVGPILGAIATALILSHLNPTPSSPIERVTIKVEPGHWLDGRRRSWEKELPSQTALAISSDGRFVVYSAIEENPGPQAKPQLYLRRMDQLEAKPIAGTEGAVHPFLSPDNRWVGFQTPHTEVAPGKLKKMPVEGGVPSPLCDVWVLVGASWGRDNSIVFADISSPGLSRVSADGGKPETLTEPDPKREEWSHGLPSWLPNGKAVLFTVRRDGLDRQPWTCLLRLDTREWRVLIQDAADARYIPTGHLVFLRQGTLMAVRFDLARLEVIGQPVALAENVMQAFSTADSFNTGAGQFGISDIGSLIYAPGVIVQDSRDSLVWVDQRGEEQPVTDLRFNCFAPRLSPDGQKIACATLGREGQVWVYDLATGTNSPLTAEGRANYPIWAPDGKRVLFSWHRSLADNLFWQPYDRSAPIERLTTSEYMQIPGSWSPDGKTVAFEEFLPDKGMYISMLEVSSGRVTPFLKSPTPVDEMFPEFSPDGRWMAYSSNESKRFEIYVQPFPGPGMRYPVSSEGGVMPVWAKNGKQLYYIWQDQVWVVDVRTDGGFATSKPRLLFKKSGLGSGSICRTFDLSLDGQRFLMVKGEQRKAAPVTEMVLFLNWFEELKRLVPARKK
jgi:Tol biopolymer transport system component